MSSVLTVKIVCIFIFHVSNLYNALDSQTLPFNQRQQIKLSFWIKKEKNSKTNELNGS